MGTSIRGPRPPHSRPGLGVLLILLGALLAAPGAIVIGLCGAAVPGACWPSPVAQVVGFVAGLGLAIAILGPLLVFTRWQYARRRGFCPFCGDETGGPAKFCGRCGRRLSAWSA